MFTKSYNIRIYVEGSEECLLSFRVQAVHVEANNHHTLNIDGRVLRFDDKHYIVVE